MRPEHIGLILLAAVGALSAQARVTASTSDTRFSEGESFQFVIKVENGEIEQVNLTGIEKFRRLSGPSTARNMQIINGQVRSSSSYSWELMPRAIGTLTIPPQTVRVSGKIYRTAPLSIEVRKASAIAADGSLGDLFLEVDVDPDGVYVGQQVTVTWTLYTKQGINGWEVLDEPSLRGFWTENLFAPNKLQLREKRVGGVQYYTAVVRRAAIFPTRSGKLEIDPFTLRIAVQRQTRRRDPLFNDLSMFGRRSVAQKTVSSLPRHLTIKPLPTAGRPPKFNGIVGNLKLSGGLNTSEIDQNEALTLHLEISGEGNVKTLELPKIDFPDGLEVFEPLSTVEPALGNIIGGSRKIEYVIIPRQAGTLTIPAIKLPYFNPRTDRYEVGSVGPLNLKVNATENQALAPEGFSRAEVALLGEDIRFVNQAPPRWFKRDQGWYNRNLLFLNFATLFLFALPWLSGRAEIYTNIFSPKYRAMRALARASAILFESRPEVDESDDEAATPENPAEVYGNFSRALTLFLNAKLGKQVQEFTIQEIDAALTNQSIDQALRLEIEQLLSQAAAARFSPISPEGAEAHRDRLVEILELVDEQWS